MLKNLWTWICSLEFRREEVWMQTRDRAWRSLWRTDHWPGRRIPEAMHSMTRRSASPGPSGRLQVAMAFSQISSRGCGGRTERGHSTQHKLSQLHILHGHTALLLNVRSWCPCTTSHSDSVAVTYPSFERLPPSQSVAHVSENPQDDDAGLEICDSGLRGQTDKT